MSDLRVQLIIDAQNNASPAIGRARNDMRGLDDQTSSLLRRLDQFVAFKIAEVELSWAASLIKTADSYEGQLAVQKELFDMAIRSRTSLDATASNYVKNAGAIKLLGGAPNRR